MICQECGKKLTNEDAYGHDCEVFAVRKLPIVKIGKKEYFIDERLGELRNVKNPSDKESIELIYARQYKRKIKKVV